MKLAVFSDIHANLEALEKAAGHVCGLGIKRIAVLGDTVGYGANPNECFEWALAQNDVLLMGNHEKALTDIQLRLRFNPMAAEAIEWTAKQMDTKLIAKSLDLDWEVREKDVTFVHSSPSEPETFPYLFGYKDAAAAFMALETRVCFTGHTHVPCCICELTRKAENLKPGVFKIPGKGKVILNPGSIGQPRDKDPRLSFGIFDDEEMTFEIVRLDYDNEKAADKIKKAGLPDYLADRLL